MDGWARGFSGSEWLLPLALPFILLSALLHSMATFILLFNRQARFCMDMNDKINGVIAGGGTMLGVGLAVFGLAADADLPLKLSVVLLFASFAIALSLADEIPEKLRM